MDFTFLISILFVYWIRSCHFGIQWALQVRGRPHFPVELQQWKQKSRNWSWERGKLATMHELPFIILARRGESNKGATATPSSPPKRQRRSQKESGKETTRVGKAINKQDTSRMSNINNKESSGGASEGQEVAEPAEGAEGAGPGSDICMNDVWGQDDAWMANGEWRNGWVTSGKLRWATTHLPTCPPAWPARKSLLIYAAPIAATRETQDECVPHFKPANGIWRQIENIYVLCKANCEAKEHQ